MKKPLLRRSLSLVKPSLRHDLPSESIRYTSIFCFESKTFNFLVHICDYHCGFLTKWNVEALCFYISLIHELRPVVLEVLTNKHFTSLWITFLMLSNAHTFVLWRKDPLKQLLFVRAIFYDFSVTPSYPSGWFYSYQSWDSNTAKSNLSFRATELKTMKNKVIILLLKRQLVLACI